MFILFHKSSDHTVDIEECLHISSSLTYRWHQRYGHLSYKGLKLLHTKEMVHGLPQLKTSNIICVDCLLENKFEIQFLKRKNGVLARTWNLYILIFVVRSNQSQIAARSTFYVLLMIIVVKVGYFCYLRNQRPWSVLRIIRRWWRRKQKHPSSVCDHQIEEESSTCSISSHFAKMKGLRGISPQHILYIKMEW